MLIWIRLMNKDIFSNYTLNDNIFIWNVKRGIYSIWMVILFIRKKSKDTIFNTYRVVENNGFISNEKKDDLPSVRISEIAATQGHDNSILMILSLKCNFK